LFVHDKSNNTVGGLTGQILFTSLHIKFLWLSESIRGNGIGSELIKRIEKEVVNCCAANIYLDTFTFQAPKFYERLGYIEVGRYTDFPLRGVDKVFYQKRIGSS
jgi:ribosomal protein S18 acetylase RimI-like enzyme